MFVDIRILLVSGAVISWVHVCCLIKLADSLLGIFSRERKFVGKDNP